MDIFGRKTRQLKARLEVMEKSLRNSFSKIRQENDSMRAWVNYHYQKGLYFQNQISRLHARSSSSESKLSQAESSIKSNISLLRELADSQKKLLQKLSDIESLKQEAISEKELNFYIENISDQIHKIGLKIEELSYLPSKISALKEQLTGHLASPHDSGMIGKKVAELQEKLKSIIAKKPPKQKLVEKVRKNSHDYIKAVALSYIKKYEKISAYQLRDMIVEEQNMTSKSTFYRILEELESMDEISTIKQGKEKIFLSKLRKTA
ncbi:hypothetical protein GF323_02040 [Candidatus Woesearchaeota archaeon]|nr:hypothetical protein [Candidatus Woesearchaeota archaeon]